MPRITSRTTSNPGRQVMRCTCVYHDNQLSVTEQSIACSVYIPLIQRSTIWLAVSEVYSANIFKQVEYTWLDGCSFDVRRHLKWQSEAKESDEEVDAWARD